MQKHQLKNSMRWILVLLGMILLSSCARHVTHSDKYPTVSAAAMKSTGVQFIHQGQQLTVVLPVDTIFRLQSQQIRDNRMGLMKQVANYIIHFRKITPHATKIWVKGYMGTTFARAERARLSNEYALAVATYLWSQHISATVLKVKGYGADNPVATHRTAAGQGANRRVIIMVK